MFFLYGRAESVLFSERAFARTVRGRPRTGESIVFGVVCSFSEWIFEGWNSACVLGVFCVEVEVHVSTTGTPEVCSPIQLREGLITDIS